MGLTKLEERSGHVSQDGSEVMPGEGIGVDQHPRREGAQPRPKRGPVAVLLVGAVATVGWMLLLLVGLVSLVAKLWGS